jgi:hypothetical protein
MKLVGIPLANYNQILHVAIIDRQWFPFSMAMARGNRMLFSRWMCW